MKPKKLNPAEKKWIEQFQALMAECPSERLSAYTTGDANISIFDKSVFDAYRAKNIRDDRDDVHIHAELGTVLADIAMPFQVAGLAG